MSCLSTSYRKLFWSQILFISLLCMCRPSSAQKVVPSPYIVGASDTVTDLNWLSLGYVVESNSYDTLFLNPNASLLSPFVQLAYRPYIMPSYTLGTDAQVEQLLQDIGFPATIANEPPYFELTIHDGGVLGRAFNNLLSAGGPGTEFGTFCTQSANFVPPTSGSSDLSLSIWQISYGNATTVERVPSPYIVNGMTIISPVTANEAPVGFYFLVTRPVFVNTVSLPDVTSGHSYNQTLKATGGIGAISWSLASGSSLPAGFTLSNGGVLNSTGIPSATPGTYTFTVVATDSAGSTAQQDLTLTVLGVTIDGTEMSGAHTLEVDVTATFSNDESTPKSVELSFNLNGTHLDKTVDNNLQQTFSGVTGETSASFFIDLAQDKVSRFTTNQEFTITATSSEGSTKATINQTAAILLPVVLVPGIDPTNPNGQGGDGTFPIMENYLQQQSLIQLRTSSITGNGYGTSNATPYRTLYTLSYNLNNSSFAQAAQNLSDLCASIEMTTYANSVNLVAHSKGGLVARQFIVSGAQPLAVNHLFMCTTPNLGSLWAKLDALLYYADYSNLYPTYPWLRYLPVLPYFATPNDELNALNQQVLPLNTRYTILYSRLIPVTPTTYTVIGSLSKGIPYPSIGFTSGDGIVPVFSQLGNNYDPDIPLTTRIPAFTGVPLETVEFDHLHIGYLENEDVESAILSSLMSDIH